MELVFRDHLVNNLVIIT